jgi:hypothetical protein
MTIQEFKAMHGLGTLKFFKSHATSRKVAGLPTLGKDVTIVTTEDFDNTLPAFVYDNPASTNGYILSNKDQKDADFEL